MGPTQLSPDSYWFQWLSQPNIGLRLSALQQILEKQRLLGERIYPGDSQLLEAYSCTPYEQIKVVILGQDPYHGFGQANGLAFSVPQNMPVPPSLKNIFKEIQRDIPGSVHEHGDLHAWAAQGVFLLNTILSVEHSKPLSHQSLNWESLTIPTLQHIAKKSDPVAFLLWGQQAQKAMKNIDTSNHLVLSSVHPSPLSAYRGFFGSGHFSLVNQFLQQHQRAGIDWNIR
jgi:uracil-DNA glycosylase